VIHAFTSSAARRVVAELQNALAPASREGSIMGQKTVRFSDLSGQLITHDDALARIVIHEHPELGDSPVEIEVLTEEAEAIEQVALRVAVVDVYLPDDIEPRRIVMEADAFDKLATDTPIEELLIAARPARRSTRASGNGSARSDRLDYTTREHAGKPHKGKITDAEKKLVREHLDEINARLAAQGLRTINVADPDHIERYGLDELARERTAELEVDTEDPDSVRPGTSIEDEVQADAEIEDELHKVA
jgi:hypothetical protein